MALHALETDKVPREIPASLGRYRVVRELGCGGMARIFEGQHCELGTRVALKVLESTVGAAPLATARFLREAKAASQIVHPNVVKVFDVGTDDRLWFIVMEFVEGADLATLLQKNGPLSLSGIVDIFLPVLSAVAMAHKAGVIHRDLKPSNVMIARQPPGVVCPIVLDFGISKLTNQEDADSALTHSESVLGTVHYMAPELTRAAKFASVASDVYALGVMLYECATGKRPFGAEGHYDLMHAIVTAPVEPPSRWCADLPPEFDALVLRAMHRDPAKRFPSAHALGSALLPFGDKTTWAMWGSEFTGQTDRRDLWQRASTSADAPKETPLAPARFAARSARRQSPMRWTLLPLSLYAAMTTALLLRRNVSSHEGASAPPGLGTAQSAALPVESNVAAVPMTGVPAPAPVAARPQEAVTSEVTPPAPPTAPAAASAPLHSVAVARGARSKLAGPSRAAPSAAESAASKAGNGPAAPQSGIGNNGALIID